MQEELIITQALVPNFYKNFRCICGACQNNCCDAAWNITFNKEDYLKIKQAADNYPELRELADKGMCRLENSDSDDKYAEFAVVDKENGKHCVFHNEDGLCGLQLVCGESVLPEVCRNYPRQSFYSPVFKEYAVSPSCEGVIRQLWDMPDGVDFFTEPLSEAEYRSIIIDEKNYFNKSFAPLRNMWIDILQNRSVSMQDRMIYLGLTVKRLMDEDLYSDFDADSWAAQAKQVDADFIKDICEKFSKNTQKHIEHNIKSLIDSFFSETKADKLSFLKHYIYIYIYIAYRCFIRRYR